MLIDLYCAQRYYDILRIRLLLTDGGGCSLLQNRHCRAMERFLYFDNGCEGENQNQNQNQKSKLNTVAAVQKEHRMAKWRII